ncbi:hypothetical protein BDW59DRAFT_180907 [Aspergillus cavernicola]|uniref:N-acetyltransferase domain-containing protein n=1 Tax=Aspergillus cavernicola TaxID=176166 RepID=A0ABR4I399_9EURO
MAATNYTIRAREPSDIPATGELLYRSKLSLTINRLLFKNWPNEEVQRKNYKSALENVDSSTVESLSVIDNASGDVLGLLDIMRKRPATNINQASTPVVEKDKGSAPLEGPDYFNPEVLSAVQTASMALDRVMEETDHIKLIYILVKPEHRSRGIGQRLMEHMFTKAKSLGLPIALVTEPQVYNFFIKQGFKDTKHVDLDLAECAPPYSGFGIFRLAGMVWYPSA